MGILRMVVCWSCLFLLLTSTFTQSCSIEYIKGRSGFVLNVEDSVSAGATYISNPDAHTQEACLNSCCLLPHCNLVLMEHGEENTLKQCFLFDCLHRNQFICSFSKKPEFTNFILDSVYQRYLRGPGRKSGEKDKRPIANAGADVVTRAGEVVTLNGIESWDDRNITKYEWTLLSGNNSVVIKNTQFLDQRLLSNLYPGVYRFQLRVTDSAGQSDNASVTILVLTQEQSEIRCLSPYKVGPCRGSFPRWYYNAASGVCEIFTFGGCKPNDNNYLSEQDCSNACTGVTVVSETRKIKPEVCNTSCGEGQFVCANGCCIDSSVECDGHQHCSDGSDEENCQQMNRTLTQLLEISVDEQKVMCVDPPLTGPCRASMSLWFYDPLKQSCFRFTYGGCGGNKNRFEKKEVCMETCSGVTESDVFAKGPFERVEELLEPPRGSVATVVIVVVLILALIGLLSCYCIRNRKRKSESLSGAVANPPVANPPVANPPVALTEESHALL